MHKEKKITNEKKVGEWPAEKFVTSRSREEPDELARRSRKLSLRSPVEASANAAEEEDEVQMRQG